MYVFISMHPRISLERYRNKWMHERLSSKVYTLEFCNSEIIFK